MSRRGRDDVYEERDYYAQEAPPPRRSAPVRARDLEEVDISVRRGGVDRDRQPEFLRQNYAREEQPLVLRKREVESFSRPIERRSPSPERERVRTRIVEREKERSPSQPPPMERIRTRVVERERSPEPERPRFRIVERARTPEPSLERVRTRIVEKRERTPSPPPERERIRTTTRIVERERERSPSPPPERERIRIVEREKERPRSPSPESSPSPPPEPPVIRAPPIHQEIITHHRHIDHGYDYQPAPTPPPAPRVREPRKKEEETEIDIYHGKGETEIDIFKSKSREREVPRPREGRDFFDDDVLYERDRDLLRVRDSRLSRNRSMSARRDRIRSDESEADFYAKKVDERAYIGEAYNGATKDWAIVDVPPGTERVRMDGVGGGSEEISWQKYNGVRRSKFLPEREREKEREYEFIEREEVTDRRVGRPLPPPRRREPDMWTEITKDLVVREAIEELGYDFEETEFFYYVMQYLRYEDVQELVDLSEHIRKERQNRIREINHERERMKEAEERERREWERSRRALPEYEDERIIEREIIYDGPYRTRAYIR
ncbi:MAG: hypothetical protein M1818_002532 [Claussenomyces sp. TS43310]|nr:MAG: hypothetical protein M1818_002532 [Claussenomyces sp. TS43310]